MIKSTLRKLAFLGLSLGLLFVALPVYATTAKVQTSATIVSFTPSCSGISVIGTGSYKSGIGRATFVLIDLAKDPYSNLVGSKYIYYSKPLPKQVTETWNSTVFLTPGTTYRVGFDIWDYTGWRVQLALDRRDFTCI